MANRNLDTQSPAQVTEKSDYVVRGYSSASKDWCDIVVCVHEEEAEGGLARCKKYLSRVAPYTEDLHIAIRTQTTTYERVPS